METIFDRFPQLSDDIFEHLDAKSLANCVEVNRKWQTTIGNQKVYLKSKIRNWSNKSGRFSKEWQMALVKIPLELLRKLSQYFFEGQGFRCPSHAPIHVAACDGDFELIKHFEAKTENKSPKNHMGESPLHLAASNGHLEICKWYIKNMDKVDDLNVNGLTPLHDAANGGHLEIFKYLLEKGADLYLKDAFGNNTLHFAARSGSYEICKLIVEVPKGIDVNTKNIGYNQNLGETPIFDAVESGALETVKLLFKRGGDLNLSTTEGNTPLHAAICFSTSGNTDIVEFILANVVDKNPENLNGDTPLHEAARNGFLEICKLICQHAKDTNPEHIENNLGETPLFNAVEEGELETVKFLYKNGGRLNARSNTKDTPL